MGGEDGRVKEGMYFGPDALVIMKTQAGNAAAKTLPCSKMFVLLHYMYFLACCWVARVGVCGLGFFQSGVFFVFVCFVFLINFIFKVPAALA